MDPDPDPRKEIEVDPDLDPERGLKWIRIRPNAVDPGGSGSGSETLLSTLNCHITNTLPMVRFSCIHVFRLLAVVVVVEVAVQRLLAGGEAADFATDSASLIDIVG